MNEIDDILRDGMLETLLQMKRDHDRSLDYDHLRPVSDVERVIFKWEGLVDPTIVDSWQLPLRQSLAEETEALKRINQAFINVFGLPDLQTKQYQYSTKSVGRRNGKKRKK